MPDKLNKVLFALQVILVLAGLLTVAKPAYRWARRTTKAIQSGANWSRWKNDGRVCTESGDPAAWLKIPETGISALVIQGATKKNLSEYPCMNENTGRLKLVMGHRDTHFRKLRNIKTTDAIYLESASGEKTAYTVCETEILPPDQLETRFTDKDKEDWLVLVTCYPFKYIGPAPKRFVVWARPLGMLTATL